MKSVFDKVTRDELVCRIERLNESSNAQWGKMNVCQMLKHCCVCEELYLGKTHHKRVFLGRIFGKIALKNMLDENKPIPHDMPTSPMFLITETGGDINTEKKRWAGLIEEYSTYSQPEFVHFFFGKMTKDQLGKFVYRHSDHHLQQFGC